MAPIRIALVGLSPSATTSWAAVAHLPYLLSARGQSQYTIVALLNSSIAAAEKARAHFNLPSSVKAYGDAALLAADAHVDFVSVITRVDVHFPTAEPSIRAGKAVYVEWPLTESLPRSLALLGDANGRDTSIIGLQGRVTPIIAKIREVLASGGIGQVLSSEVRVFASFGGANRPGTVLEGVLETMFTQRAIGGNHITVSYAHMIDIVHSVLGEFKSFESRLQIQRPDVAVIAPDDGSQVRTVRSDVPDLMAVHGELAGGKAGVVADGATLSVSFRPGPPFKDEAAFVWHMYGEKGVLRLTSPGGPSIQACSYPDLKVEVHDFATDGVTDVTWEWQDWQTELPFAARLVGDVYNRYAQWLEREEAGGEVPEEEDWPRLQDALTRQEEIHKMLSEYDLAQQH